MVYFLCSLRSFSDDRITSTIKNLSTQGRVHERFNLLQWRSLDSAKGEGGGSDDRRVLTAEVPLGWDPFELEAHKGLNFTLGSHTYTLKCGLKIFLFYISVNPSFIRRRRAANAIF